MEKKLYRKDYDKIIGGVASGLADYLNMDVSVVRLIFILMAIFGFSGVLIYIVLWIVLPSKNMPDLTSDYRVYEEEKPIVATQLPSKKSNARMIMGLILIGFGSYFLLREFHVLPYWFNLGKLWPLALIIPGLVILLNSKKKKASESEYKAPPAEPKMNNTETDTTTNDNENSDKPVI